MAARAPGKLIWLGEYAVLEGAPCIVMAVDRYCRVTLRGTTDARVTIEAANLDSPPLSGAVGDQRIEWDSVPPALAALASAASAWHRGSRGFAARIDSRELYQADRKLGLGSSAAALTAFALALTADQSIAPPVMWRRLRALHSDAQGGRGSGVDLAAALHGGLLGFAGDEVEPLAQPEGLYWCTVWSGRPASTSAMLEQLDGWRQADSSAYLSYVRQLHDLAVQAVSQVRLNKITNFIKIAQEYREILWSMGESGGLPIATTLQRELARAGDECGVVYKSCGAGGGDVGIAFGDEPGKLDRFATRAAELDCPRLELGIGSGASVTSGNALAL